MTEQEIDRWCVKNTPTPREWKKWNRCWDRQAKLGRCDVRGAREYQRVTREWILAGKPRGISGFIRCRANLPPSGDANN